MSGIISKRCSRNWLVLLLAVLAMGMPSISVAQEEKPKGKAKAPAKAASGLQGYYAVIASELQLTDDQRKQLAASLAARSDAMKKWDDEHGAKLTQLSDAQKKAREAKDKEATKQAGDELKKLRETRAAIEDQGKAKLQEILTADQRRHLQGYNLYVGTMIRLSKAQLTDAQKVRAKAISLETGKALDLDIDAKALDKVKLDLASRIETELLTAEQREALAKPAPEKSKGKSKSSEKEQE